MIPGLGAQRLMGLEVVRFPGEKSLSLLRPVILLYCKPKRNKHHLTEIVRLRTGPWSCGGNIIKVPHRNPLVKIYVARQEPKTKKSCSKSNLHVKIATKWLPGWNKPLDLEIV